jgi:hypothetical protein
MFRHDAVTARTVVGNVDDQLGAGHCLDGSGDKSPDAMCLPSGRPPQFIICRAAAAAELSTPE